MPQIQKAQSDAAQNFTSENNSYVVLDAYDSLSVSRCAEVYLQALEHYIIMNVVDFPVKDELLRFLRLYRAESVKGLNQTADILKAALANKWGDNDG
jgi:hypothetical protein